MEQTNKERKQKAPHLLRIVAFIFIAQAIFFSLGTIALFTNFAPFEEMKALAYDLNHSNVLGIPTRIFVSMITILDVVAAVGLYKLKRWGLYLFVVIFIISVSSTIYAKASIVSLLKDLELYAILIGIYYWRRLE